jgi:hypothetical protein
MIRPLFLAHLRPAFCLAVAIFAAFVLTASAQLQTPPSSLPGARQHTDEGPDVWQQQQQKEQEKKANLQRQQEIKKDTEKLLELATELKQSVDKSNENTMSLDVIRKAEQIEKLAKSVKEKMKGP